jgi:hypothetical protein
MTRKADQVQKGANAACGANLAKIIILSFSASQNLRMCSGKL